MIVFLDETGFSQRPSVRRTWSPQGQTPVLKEYLNGKHLSGIGALGLRPGTPRLRLFLSLRPGTINGEAVISFLRSLRRHWLTVEQLRGYAPELNPLEDLWANLDACELANLVPDDLDELARQVRKGVRRVRRRPQLPWAFLKHARLVSQTSIPHLYETHPRPGPGTVDPPVL